jgi:hypothetical protein
MLRTLAELTGYAIGAINGELGTVGDFLFDDRSWTIRYLVVDTGAWLAGRRVLLSPVVIGARDRPGRRLLASLTREQVRHSPGADSPSSPNRADEERHLAHYRLPPYWGGSDLWGRYHHPGLLLGGLAHDAAADGPGAPARGTPPRLCSASALDGYRVLATDGDAGCLTELLVDEDSWNIRDCIVDTGAPGAAVRLAPSWITALHPEARRVDVALRRATLRGAPRWDPAAPPAERG